MTKIFTGQIFYRPNKLPTYFLPLRYIITQSLPSKDESRYIYVIWLVGSSGIGYCLCACKHKEFRVLKTVRRFVIPDISNALWKRWKEWHGDIDASLYFEAPCLRVWSKAPHPVIHRYCPWVNEYLPYFPLCLSILPFLTRFRAKNWKFFGDFYTV